MASVEVKCGPIYVKQSIDCIPYVYIYRMRSVPNHLSQQNRDITKDNPSDRGNTIPLLQTRLYFVRSILNMPGN